MKHLQIKKSPVELGLDDYRMTGDPIINQTRKIKDILGIFQDEKAFSNMSQEKLVYTVQAWLPVAEGTLGGLFFGASTIYPGKVGNEYFMTKGHFHLNSDRAEFYWGIKGKGMLILMDRDRNTWAEEVYPGSLHYIDSEIGHRLANTGDENLIVGACWPSDAGHNYEEIAKNGFSARLFEVDGKPKLM
ncbi:glucose-6-phosphate isomerase family protein [Mariniflexile sp.]|uniref:glucose-6-phosphate isomerase family protein n=1 Tax=Mariniflexile sp. TaxID=1979402 RepID=UPI0040470F81